MNVAIVYFNGSKSPQSSLVGFFPAPAFQGCEGVEGERMVFIVIGGGVATNVGVTVDVKGAAGGKVTL